MLKLVTYNVYEWRNIENIDNFTQQVEYILSFAADIICLQEVLIGKYDLKVFDNYQIIPCVFKVYFVENYDFGNLILINKKHKLLSQKCIYFDNNPHELRSCIRVKISPTNENSEPIYIYNTHLEVAGPDNLFREYQIKRIIKDAKNKRSIIIGDLNTFDSLDIKTYTNAEKTKIIDGLSKKGIISLNDMTQIVDLLSSSGFLSTTFLTENTTKPITTRYKTRSDHIFLSTILLKDWLLMSNFIDKYGENKNVPTISDHFPLLCSVKYNYIKNMSELSEVITTINSYSNLYKNYVIQCIDTIISNKKYANYKLTKKIGEGFNADVYDLYKEPDLVLKIQKINKNTYDFTSLRVEYIVYKLLKHGNFKIKTGKILLTDPLQICMIKKRYDQKKFANKIAQLTFIQTQKLKQLFEKSMNFSRKTRIGLDLKADNLWWDDKINDWLLIDCGPRIEYLPYGFSLDLEKYESSKQFDMYLKQWRKTDPDP